MARQNGPLPNCSLSAQVHSRSGMSLFGTPPSARQTSRDSDAVTTSPLSFWSTFTSCFMYPSTFLAMHACTSAHPEPFFSQSSAFCEPHPDARTLFPAASPNAPTRIRGLSSTTFTPHAPNATARVPTDERRPALSTLPSNSVEPSAVGM